MMRTAGKRLDQLKKKRDWSRTASLHSVVASSRPLIFFCTVFQHDGFFKSEGGLFFGSRCLLLYKLIASLPPGGPACPQGRGTHSAASKRRLKRPCAKMGQCPLCCAAVKVSISSFNVMPLRSTTFTPLYRSSLQDTLAGEPGDALIGVFGLG